VTSPRYGVAVIRILEPSTDAEACDAIVRGLPGWFGLAEGIQACAQAVRAHEGLVALDDDEVVGFITSEPRTISMREISWMAVMAERRGTGIGTELIDGLIASQPARVERLLVKTLSDRDGDPGAEYAATRAFYIARGFSPLAELDIWGPDNPCQLLGRPIARTSSRA